MATKSNEERLDRLEQVVHVIAEDQLSLQKLIADLARETRIGFDRVAQQFAESNRKEEARARETDERFRRTDERMRQTDERIDKLVVAIGQMISDRPRA